MYNQNQAILKDYEKAVDTYRDTFMQAYNLGLEDGTINPVKNVETFYFSTTHSLMELCKKLSVNKALLTQDKSARKNAEVACLVKIILNSLKTL